MKLEFKNGSRIVDINLGCEVVRSEPKDFYIEIIPELKLKWHQKLWLYIMLKYQCFKY